MYDTRFQGVMVLNSNYYPHLFNNSKKYLHTLKSYWKISTEITLFNHNKTKSKLKIPQIYRYTITYFTFYFTNNNNTTFFYKTW